MRGETNITSVLMGGVLKKGDIISEQINMPSTSVSSEFDIAKDVSKTGYTALGIMDWNLNYRTSALNITGARLINTTAHLYGTTTTTMTVNANIKVLYKKN